MAPRGRCRHAPHASVRSRERESALKFKTTRPAPRCSCTDSPALPVMRTRPFRWAILVGIVAASSLMFCLQRFQFLEQIVAFMQLPVCAGRGASTQCTTHPSAAQAT